MHAIKIALRSGHSDNMSEFGSVGIGPSTANQRIEMIWSILALRRPVIQFGRDIFLSLVHNKMQNTDPIHLKCIRVCFLPVVQKHVDIFKKTWNHHRMLWNTRYGVIPGILTNMYHMPMLYGTVDYIYIYTIYIYILYIYIYKYIYIHCLVPWLNPVLFRTSEKSPCLTEFVQGSSEF